MPGTPSRTIAQSCPGDRRRRVSQPSYSLPLCPKSARATGSAVATRFSLAAKDSSFAATTAPPRARSARSGSFRKSVIGASLAGGGSPPGHPEEDRVTSPNDDDLRERAREHVQQ